MKDVIGIRRLVCVCSLTMSFSLMALAAAGGKTIASKTVALCDVKSAVAAARDGDTVVVPAGTSSWISGLSITEGITLQGAGEDKTVILDEVDRSAAKQQDSGRSKNASQIGFGKSRARFSRPISGRRDGQGPKTKSANALIDVQLKPTQSFRLSGFTLRKGASVKRMPGGVVRITGTCQSVRVDHCHFDQLSQIGIWLQGWLYGVVDHCRWDVSINVQAMSVNNGATWGGGSNRFGDGSWAAPTDFGSDKFIFVEDCLFNNLTKWQTAGKIDGQFGGRFVSRFNRYVNTSVISGHGTESGDRHRGIRAAEFYYNTRTGNLVQGWGETRSGTRMYHHNRWTGPGKGGMPLNVHREFWAFKGFGGATGNNPWDMNDTEGDGRWVEGHRPYLHATGTAASDSVQSDGSAVLTASGDPAWKPDGLRGMMLKNASHPAPGGPVPSRIISNTRDTVTFSADDGGYARGNVAPKRFARGERFAVYRLLAALDQVGRGQGDLLAGNPAVNTVTGGQSWPHERLEPIYGFENRTNGTLTPVTSAFPTVQENRDYYNQTNGFDGSAGIGVGPLTNRPRSCTPGVAYWATDEGEWNSTHDGPDGQLYICTGPNTWSLQYKPYAYPHPLVVRSSKMQ